MASEKWRTAASRSPEEKAALPFAFASAAVLVLREVVVMVWWWRTLEEEEAAGYCRDQGEEEFRGVE